LGLFVIVAIGLVIALALTRLMKEMLFGVEKFTTKITNGEQKTQRLFVSFASLLWFLW
jgi:hypothetical protein